MEYMKKEYLRYIYPVILFFFISLAYFIPDILEGKKINQHDIVQFKGMSKEIVDHREKIRRRTIMDEQHVRRYACLSGLHTV